MFSIIRWLPKLAVAAALLAGPSAAHVGTRIYPVYEIPTADIPAADGVLDDWEGVVPGASVSTADFQANIPTDADDFSARVLLAWNAEMQRIYVGAEIIDDIHRDLLWDYDGATAVEADQFYVLVDADHSGGEYVFAAASRDSVEAAALRSYRGAQVFGAVISNDPSLPGFARARYARTWSLEPPYVALGTAVTGEDPSYAVVEMAITPFDDLDQAAPENSRPSTLLPGRVIGLDLQFLDLDELDGAYPTYYQITLDPWRDPWTASEFLDAVLVPCQRPGCSTVGTRVEPSSWGRIKEALDRVP